MKKTSKKAMESTESEESSEEDSQKKKSFSNRAKSVGYKHPSFANLNPSDVKEEKNLRQTIQHTGQGT